MDEKKLKDKKDKILKNLADGGSIALGVGASYFAMKLAKGKLPSPWLEPLVALVPGVAATLLASDEKSALKYLGLGAITIGVLDVANKATSGSTNSVVAKINEFVPKITGLAGMGEYDAAERQVMGFGYTPGEQSVMGLSEVPDHLRLVA
jgi:hypothetical protein